MILNLPTTMPDFNTYIVFFCAIRGDKEMLNVKSVANTILFIVSIDFIIKQPFLMFYDFYCFNF